MVDTPGSEASRVMFPRQGNWDVNGGKFHGTDAEVQQIHDIVDRMGPIVKDHVSAVFEAGCLTDAYIEGFASAMALVGLEHDY